MSSFVLYEGHIDNLQQHLKSNQMLDSNIFLFVESLYFHYLKKKFGGKLVTKLNTSYQLMHGKYSDE